MLGVKSEYLSVSLQDLIHKKLRKIVIVAIWRVDVFVLLLDNGVDVYDCNATFKINRENGFYIAILSNVISI